MIIFIILLILILTPSVLLRFKKFTVLGYYSQTRNTVLCDFPGGIIHSFWEDTNKRMLITKTNNGYYGYVKNDETGVLCFFDESLKKIDEVQITMDVVKMIDIQNKLGILVKEKGNFQFYSVDFTEKKVTCLYRDIPIQYENDFAAYGDLIVYKNLNHAIMLCKNGKEWAFPHSGYNYLSIRDENHVLVFKSIVNYIRFGEIKEYHLESGKTTHLRFAICPSTTCCLSPDGRYLLSFEIINSQSQYNPVLIDLRFPRQYKSHANCLDFDYVEWQQ